MAVVDLIPALVPIISRCRNDITWKKIGPKTVCKRNVPLSKTVLRKHLSNAEKCGLCPIEEGQSTTRLAVLDLDDHTLKAGWEAIKFATKKVCERFEQLNFYPVPFKSSSGNGVHIFIIWELPQDCYSVREFIKNEILIPLGFNSGARGVVAGEIEIFPKQDHVPLGGAGNQFILPLAGLSVPLDPLLDYEPVSRDDALHIEWKESPPIPTLEREEPRDKKSRKPLQNGELHSLKSALDILTSSTDYDQWVKIGMCLHAETYGSEEGFEVWDSWSANAPDIYPGEEELRKKWASFRSDKQSIVTAGTIKKLAAEKGWQEDYSHDFTDVSGTGDKEKSKEAPNRFDVIRADTFIQRPSVKWRIKGILPDNDLTLAYGGSGDGKTFVILDMALAIARGVQWNGRRVTKGRVVYVCAEGAGGFTSRIKAYVARENINLGNVSENFGIIPATPNFRTTADVKLVADKIKDFGKTHLIVIDTLAQVTAGADENTGKDMSIVLSNAKMLNDLTGATVLLIHHSGKDTARGARGWSGIKAPLAAEFEISREGDMRKFWVEKMKDGRDGFGWNFHLETSIIGEDEEGDVIESCIVKFDETPITSRRKSTKLGTWETAFMEAWQNLGGGTVAIDAVMDEAKTITTWDKENGKDKRRGLLRRAIHTLVKKGEITIRDEKVVNELGV